MIIKSQLKAIFIATLVAGLLSYYLLYYAESFCLFSSCVDSVPKMAPPAKKAPSKTPKQGLYELDNGR